MPVWDPEMEMKKINGNVYLDHMGGEKSTRLAENYCPSLP